jgi:hypothetical protein
VGAVATDIWQKAGHQPANGVIVADPVGLAAVLTLTGPIEVEGWNGQITAENVADVTMRQAYEVFEGDEEARDDFMGNVTEATWDALEAHDLGGPSHVLVTLGKAARGGHFMVWFADPTEEKLAVRGRADGAMRRTTPDLLHVTTQNAAANKLDLYLRRDVSYRAQVVPAGNREIQLDATVTVGLRNDAPPSGLTPYVAGPNAPGIGAGENRTFVSVYTPLQLQSGTIDGAPAATEAGLELGSNVYSRYLQLAPGASTQLALTLSGLEQLEPGGWYELNLPRQPQIDATPTHITLELASGWRFAEARGLKLTKGGRVASLDRPLDHAERLRVRIVRDRGSGLWGRLQRGADLAVGIGPVP